MNKINTGYLLKENYTINIEDYLDTVKLNIAGNIDLQHHSSELAPYFENLHNTILQNNIKYVYCDVSNLNFINSRSLKCILEWVLKVSSLDGANQYKIILKLNIDKDWHKYTFLAMFKMYTNVVEFEF